jgi:ABC-type nitrate/sulfonate/bicarbonate transport system permease component
MSTSVRNWNIGLSQVYEWLYSNSYLIFLQSVVVLAIVWWFIATVFNATDVISSPLLVGVELFDIIESGEWVRHVTDTTRRVLYGFILTTIIGTILGMLMGWSDFWERALQDYIAVGLALPSLFSAIFAAMWFGVSDITPMIAAALIAFPFLTQNVYEGMQNADQRLVEMSKSFDVSRPRLIRRVVVDSVLPEWFAGIRYAFALSWKITTLAELVSAESGIGFMIEQELQLLSLTGVLAWTLLFTILMLFFEYGILQPIENRMFDWREDSSVAWV